MTNSAVTSPISAANICWRLSPSISAGHRKSPNQIREPQLGGATGRNSKPRRHEGHEGRGARRYLRVLRVFVVNFLLERRECPAQGRARGVSAGKERRHGSKGAGMAGKGGATQGPLKEGGGGGERPPGD